MSSEKYKEHKYIFLGLSLMFILSLGSVIVNFDFLEAVYLVLLVVFSAVYYLKTK